MELSLLFLLGFKQEKSVYFEGRNRIGFLYSMKIKEQTRKLAADSTWVRQGEADVV
ncbi:hypothetical protein SMIM3I_00716 [Streptococcus mitis]|uniref:Uncharacterized protein n=1 Tax=Streptococcus mitis TaxID=28037 RepID=A0A150NMP6_STRMT|nr:hypothetical protein SMIM3I_00716 [Streptococcus mitis]